MNASFHYRSRSRYYLQLNLVWFAKIMVLNLMFLWIVNIIILLTRPSALAKSTPCFTDGDCPSALEKCIYGSWKGLGNCHRKTRDSGIDLGEVRQSGTKNVFRSRRVIRRKRNPSSIWDDSYLSQKRWNVWLPAKDNTDVSQFRDAALHRQDSYHRFYEIATDLLKFGRSYITVKGINYTVAVLPSIEGTSDWLIVLTKDKDGAQRRRIRYATEGRHTPNAGQASNGNKQALADTKAKLASILLENSFPGSYGGGDAIVNISVRYPIRASPRRRYGRGSNIRLRFRRQLPGRMMELIPVDPLVNHVAHVEPVIPAAEDIFGRNIGKRSTRSKVIQRIRRELEELEDDVAPLPKVVRDQDDGPIIIEDLFDDSVRSPTLRKRRDHEASMASESKLYRARRHKRHHKLRGNKPLSTSGMINLSGRSQKRNKRKLSHLMPLPVPERKGRSAPRANHQATMNKVANKHFPNRRISKRGNVRSAKAGGKAAAAGQAKGGKQTGANSSGNNGTLSGTTEPPDPFAKLKNTKEPHIDYYDVSKRNLLKDEEDIDPESSLDEGDSESPDEDESAIDDIPESESRRKRQTLAEELEDDDEQDIPPWRETVELLRRANTFGVPAHDSTGHVVLVRRVRDLGALDLAESLSKLKETMAKIFGRCSPARRRKRSHRASPEVVTDQLSNGETWEIQGEGQEAVEQAKIDVHMDEDKPYNVTTVLRPMGKRSYRHNHKNHEADDLKRTRLGLHSGTSREMRDILEQNARLDKIPHLNQFGNEPDEHDRNNFKRIINGNGRLGCSKRNEENIPLDKDVHLEAQEGSPVEIDLTVDQQQGADQPIAEVQSNTLSTALSETAVSKKNQRHQPVFSGPRSSASTDQSSSHMISRNPSPSLRGSHLSPQNKNLRRDAIKKVRHGRHEKCMGCEQWSRFAQKMPSHSSAGRKIVREPYIITRKYNDSKTRPTRSEGEGQKMRDSTSSLDRANLLYLADGDPLPSSWRAPLANLKRDVDVEVEVENGGNDTDSNASKEKNTGSTTAASPSTVKAIIEKEKEEDVFSGNSSVNKGKETSSIEASVFAHKAAIPGEATPVVLGSRVSPGLPVRTNVVNLSANLPKSVLTVTSGESSPVIPSGGLDWGISGSSDRLMALISGIEKALRVPLGGSDGGLDEVTVDDGSNSFQTQVISSQPEFTEQKSNYVYSFDEPQSSLVVTSPQEKKSDVLEMDITSGAGTVATNVGEVKENIYLKGFDVPRKPAKPLFVDAAAKKMIWTEPSYTTVISSGMPKYKLPVSYIRLYNGGIQSMQPTGQRTNVANLDSGTVKDVKIENDKHITIGNFIKEPSDTAVTNIRGRKITEILEPPGLLEVQKNVILNRQLMDKSTPPEKDRDTVVKVVSSVRSDEPESQKATVLNGTPIVTVHMDGHDDGSSVLASKDLPPNIRILHKERDSDGKFVATIGSQDSVKTKKDLQEFSDALRIPLKHSMLLSSNGVILAENNINGITKDPASKRLQGDKRSAQHIYRVPNTMKAASLKRRENVKSGTVASKRANVNPSQSAPIVHTYSKDPGVQGATMEMMHGLASRIKSQNAKRRKIRGDLGQNSVECAAENENCRRRRHTQSSAMTEQNIHDIDNYFKSKQFSVPKRILTNKQVKKRDISGSVFEQPKVFIVSPKTIFEAPGTKYKFIDPQGRNDATRHLAIYTMSNVSTNDANTEPSEEQTVSDVSSSGDNNFGHDRASSLPMSHEKALQEAEGQERFKIVDSVEGFSVEAPSFDKKVTSGGQISEDRMAPVPLEVDRMSLSNEENRISITTDVEPRKHKPGLKVSAIETSDRSSSQTPQQKIQTVEYSAEPDPDIHAHVDKMMQLKESHPSPNTRKKRRSPNAETSDRRTREEKIQALRTELQNLNSIGSKLGLNFFDKTSIDRIVREVTSHQKGERSQKKEFNKRGLLSTHAERKRKRKTFRHLTDTQAEKTDSIPFKSEAKSARQRKMRRGSRLNSSSSPMGETVSSTSVADQSNHQPFPKAKRKRHNHASKDGHRQRKKALNHGMNHDHSEMPYKRRVVSSKKSPRDVEINSENDADVEVAPIYHYSNGVKNDDLLVIPNPEKHEESNNRQREETLTISNNENEPMELTAVLRGRRKKREIRPDEFFRFSAKEPLFRKSMVSPMVMPSDSALTGQWQKQFIPVRMHRNENIRKTNEASPVIQNAPMHEPNQESVGPSNAFGSTRASPYQRSQQMSKSFFPREEPDRSMNKLEQISNVFSPERNFGPESRKKANETIEIIQSHDSIDSVGKDSNGMLNGGQRTEIIKQESLKPIRTQVNGQKAAPAKTSNMTKQESAQPPRKAKDQGMGVWKKLGEIFDIGSKETVRPEAESTVSPTAASSPAPLQAMVPPAEEVGPREPRVRSGLRAAIVDRLLHDLRKMASARGSEMARAESDLIEILHDYQTDLMDEDEQTIAGEPFQGVRIHDSVAVPVVYRAVPIKTGSRPQHRLVVRSSDHRTFRDRPGSRDDPAPYNPP